MPAARHRPRARDRPARALPPSLAGLARRRPDGTALRRSCSGAPLLAAAKALGSDRRSSATRSPARSIPTHAVGRDRSSAHGRGRPWLARYSLGRRAAASHGAPSVRETCARTRSVAKTPPGCRSRLSPDGDLRSDLDTALATAYPRPTSRGVLGAMTSVRTSPVRAIARLGMAAILVLVATGAQPLATEAVHPGTFTNGALVYPVDDGLRPRLHDDEVNDLPGLHPTVRRRRRRPRIRSVRRVAHLQRLRWRRARGSTWPTWRGARRDA